MSRVKSIDALTVADLDDVPIWEQTGSGKPNQGNVRPRPRLHAIDLTVGRGTFIAATRFDLADGTQASGYSSPGPWPEQHETGYLAPAIIIESAQVPFWFVLDADPADDFAERYYRLLGKSRDEVFPVCWSVAVDVPPGAKRNGTLHAFSGLVWTDGVFTEFTRT